jgi:hypothetical protein
MVCLSLTFMSASTVKISTEAVTNSPVIIAPTFVNPTKSKLNFFERLLVRYVQKRFKKPEDTVKADKHASSALTFGVAAISCLVLGLFIPYILAATIPLGIVAMTQGSSALKGGTSEPGKARTGRALGLGSLIAFGVLLIVAVAVLAAFFAGWR